LELSYAYENSYCNRDIKIENGTSNYFERGKHANDCHDTFNDPLYMTKFAKLCPSSGYIIEFASNACNYYEIGGDKCPPYLQTTRNVQVHHIYMHWSTSICCDLFTYKIPMHSKKVKLRCCKFYTWCCSISCSTLIITLIDLTTPWDPGIF
jgi:hypothetical protein